MLLRKKSCLQLLNLGTLSIALAVGSLSADTFTWQGDRNDNFGNERNWSQNPGSGDVPGSDDDVILPANADRFRLDLGDETRTVGSVFFQSDGSTGSGGHHWEFFDGTFSVDAGSGNDVRWSTSDTSNVVTVGGAMSFSGVSNFTGGSGGAHTLAFVDSITGTGPISIDTDGDDDALRLDTQSPGFTGTVNVTDGTLILNHLNALPNSVVDIFGDGNLEFISGAVVSLDSTNETIDVPSGKTLKVKAGGKTFGNISGAGVFNLITGTTTFEGGSSFNGTLDLDAGAIFEGSYQQAILDIASGVSARVDADATFRGLSGSGVLRFSDGVTVTVGGGSGFQNLFGGRLARDGSIPGKIILSATIAEYIYAYDGSLTDTFLGEVEARGNLTIGNNTFQSVTLNMIGAAELKIPNSGGTEIGTLNTEAGFALRSSLTIGALNEDMTITGDLSGSGALTKVGAGLLSLDGDVTSSGKVTINTGTFEVEQATQIAGDLEIDSILNLDISANDAAGIDVGGQLDVSGATLNLNISGTQTAQVIELLSFDSLAGTFATVTGIPYGYQLFYGFAGQKTVALVDITGPDVASFQSVTGTDLPTFDLIFKEAVTGFDASDLDVRLTGFTGSPTIELTGSGTTYRAVVSGLIGSGEVSLGFSASAIFADPFNNPFSRQGGPIIHIAGLLTNHYVYDFSTYQESITLPEAEFLLVSTGSLSRTAGFISAPTVKIGNRNLQRIAYNDAFFGPSGIFLLANPPSGTQTLEITFSNNTRFNEGSYAIYAVNGLDADTPFEQTGSAEAAAAAVAFEPIFSGSLILQTGLDLNRDFNLSVNGQSDYPGLTRSTSGSAAAHYLIEQSVFEAVQLETPAAQSAAVFRAPSVTSYTNVAPTSAITASPGTDSPTSASTVAFAVTFSEPVTELAASDFSISFGSNPAPTRSLSGSGTNYTLTLSNVDGDGFLQVSLPAGSAIDAGGVPTLIPSEQIQLVVDQKAPVLLTNVPRVTRTNASSVTFDVTFSEPVIGFGDANLIKTSGVNFDSFSYGGTKQNRTVTIEGLSGDGSMSLNFTLGTIRDNVGNLVENNVFSAPVTLDNTAPTITLYGSSSLTLDFDSTFVDPGASVSDNFDTGLSAIIGGDTVDTSSAGNYEITYDASDVVGNAAAQVTRTVIVRTPFETWASTFGLTGDDALPTADPDLDGRLNLEEFALDGNPNSASDEIKQKISFVSEGEDEFFALTVPVQTGGEFSGSPDLSKTVNGVTYTFRGTSDLAEWKLPVQLGVTVDDEGLSELSPAYEYRSFWIPGALDSGFINIKLQLTN